MSILAGIIHFEDAAAKYNDVPPFQQQAHEISIEILRAAAAIFVRHNEQAQFALTLIHRHFDLLRGYVMVHSMTDKDEDICVPQELGSRKIRPCMFRLCRDQQSFIPIEYHDRSSESSVLPSAAFLSDLGVFLVNNNLDKVLGLSWNPDLSKTWIEQLVPAIGGTIATRTDQKLGLCNDVVTEWSFGFSSGQLTIRAIRGCKTTTSGVHEPKTS